MNKITLLLVLLLGSCFITLTANAQFSGGNGSESSPYQIATLADLRFLSENNVYWDSCFVQTADIDASETRNWNISGSDTLVFSPIGTPDNKFTGSYYGQGYSINNLYINRPSTNYVGLFGYVDGTEIDSLGIINCNITGANYTGGFLGMNAGSSFVRNCFATGNVKGKDNTGGLVARNISSTIRNSYATCTVVTKHKKGSTIE